MTYFPKVMLVKQGIAYGCPVKRGMPKDGYIVF